MPPDSIAKFALMKGRPLFEQTMTDPQGKQWGKDLCLDWDNKAKWEELTPEKKVLAGFVNLPGAQSTSVSFKVALEFAFPSKDTQGHVPTLFVVCCHNYDSFNGFRMDSALHSAHPYEQEVLLMEGVPVAVLGHDDVLIDNSLTTTDPFWAKFNNKTISIVYLFHSE